MALVGEYRITKNVNSKSELLINIFLLFFSNLCPWLVNASRHSAQYLLGVNPALNIDEYQRALLSTLPSFFLRVNPALSINEY